MTLVQLIFSDKSTGLALPKAAVVMNGLAKTTDDNGSVLFDGIPMGTYKVRIFHPTLSLDAPAGIATIEVNKPVFQYFSFPSIPIEERPPPEEPLPPIEEIIEELEEIEIPVVPVEPVEPIIPVVPIVPIEPVVLPSLPWYAAWLQPIIDHVTSLTESVVNHTTPIFEPVTAFFGQLSINLIAAWEGFLARVGQLFNAFTNAGVRTSISNIKGLAEGSPEWQKELADTLDPMVVDLLKGYATALNVTTYEKSPLTGEDAVAALEDMKNRLLATAIANFSMHAAIESGSIGQFEFMKDLDPMVTSKFGMDALIQAATMKPIEKAVLIPAEYEYNTRYRPSIPPYIDLINMVVKEVIDLPEFETQLAKLGFSSEWALRIWDSHFIPPNYTQLLQAHYRGVIDREELDRLSILVDLDPRYKNIWDSLVEVIPPYTELTNELVKEVIDLPTYTKYLQWHGFNPVWAKRIWDAHFIPPSLGDILTAWRRELITEDRVDELMILVDLDPRFKDIFDTRKYIDPSLRAARYMFETRAIDIDGVEDIVRRQGFRPEDTKAVVEYLTKFQERRFRDRYLTALGMGVLQGAYTEDDLTEAVLEAGYTKEVAYWMIQTANVRRRIAEVKPMVVKPKLLSVSDLKKAYILDKVTEDDLRIRLATKGYEVTDIDILIELLNQDKFYEVEGRKKVSLTQSELLNAYRYGEITRDALMTELQLRGLALDETETLIRTKEKQWGIGE